MPLFPWILLWICLPLSGGGLLFFSPLDQERSKKVAIWCIGWFFAFSLYLIFFRARNEEYYPLLQLSLKTDPQILWTGLGCCVLVTVCMLKEGGAALGLTLVALLSVCFCIHQWVWFWGALECLFMVNLGFFISTVRMHKALIDGFWRHCVCFFCMAFFIYQFYLETGSFQNSPQGTSASIVYLGLGLLCYTPVWPVFKLWVSFFSKSKLLGKIMGGVFSWLVFFCALRGHKMPLELCYLISGLTLMGLVITYRKKSDMTHFLPQFILTTGPLYCSIFLHHSFESLVLVMINTGSIVMVCSKIIESKGQESALLYMGLIGAIVQPFFFLWKGGPPLPLWERAMVGVLLGWISFRFYKSVPKEGLLWTKDRWSLGLMVWNITFLVMYELFS